MYINESKHNQWELINDIDAQKVPQPSIVNQHLDREEEQTHKTTNRKNTPVLQQQQLNQLRLFLK